MIGRGAALFVDGIFQGVLGGVMMIVPLLGPIASAILPLVRESVFARWSDKPSLGRGIIGLRVISLAGPEHEFSALLVRSSIVPVCFTTSAVLSVIPVIGGVFPLLCFFAILAIPLQVATGDGRTWVDRLANTQVIVWA
jgi:hypothetical protein